MSDAAASVAPNVLSQDEAQARVARVRAVEYDLRLSLTQGASSYDGEVTVRFQLERPDEGVFLDCTSQTIHSVWLNGTELADSAYRHERNRLYLSDALALNNVVTIRYTNEYDHIGAGLHQFVDPEDGEEYLYTHFEPYDAHRLLPCFDQPDIKAALTLTVTAPTAWEVAANYPVVSSEAGDDGRTTRFDAAGCILVAAEKATWMANETIQALGGNGYINDYPAGRLLRDAKLFTIGAGTSEIRRMLIGRELFHASAA